MVLQTVVQQHAEEAVWLREMRSRAIRAPNSTLWSLGRLDERMAAHLDGLLVAHSQRAEPLEFELDSVGQIFAAGASAIEGGLTQLLESLLNRAESQPIVQRGLASAFGWASRRFLRGIVKDLLNSVHSSRRLLGIAACSMHRVDIGPALDEAAVQAESDVRARALRAAGELGRSDLLGVCRRALADDDDQVSFWAARSTLLLGDRNNAMDVLRAFVSSGSSFRTHSLDLLLMSMAPSNTQDFLRGLAAEHRLRTVVKGSGLSGDPQYLPWLIEQLSNPELARLAGESISLVTGVNIPNEQLDTRRPEGLETGPSDDPADDQVAMDEDEGLPWPDAVKIQAWWHANSQRFQPGVRYFMGQPLNRDHCLRVLKEGFQRQRIAAALHLSLLSPGTPLFEWRAPAWRQQRLLAEMS
jgi:uncharacterized protein (TIGR02270 family)